MSLLFILCDDIGLVSLLIQRLGQFYYCVHILYEVARGPVPVSKLESLESRLDRIDQYCALVPATMCRISIGGGEDSYTGCRYFSSHTSISNLALSHGKGRSPSLARA